MIRRLLIANRGEIALRIIRACRERGIRSIAVYSDADADAPHVAAADEARRIGPPPAVESYLNQSAVIGAARASHADAVHPGYGFLSENAAFAAACETSGLVFVGPPSKVIARMGVKTAARETVRAAGVPVVPGESTATQDDATVIAAVERVGYPALIKAAAGGGGKGMRAVRSRAETAEAVATARREAERAFGDGAVYVERLVDRAKHIEVQVFGDTHGTVLHLFERDCTLQRRHQKVIEEAPAPTLAPAVRERLLAAAVRAARSVGYVNAGTVEFLLEGEGEDARFYFLEMNTRLQVEHPVTEAVTGLDLVQLQLTVAEGGALPFAQADVRCTGHAMEARVYAEDSIRLLPQSGRLLRVREPSGPGLRIDSGVREGQTIGIHYDPLLAKVITYAEVRKDTIARLRDALGRYEILGIRHNLPFLGRLLARPEVASSDTHTRFIEEHLTELAREPGPKLRLAAAAVAAMAVRRGPAAVGTSGGDLAARDPWRTLGPIAW